jgi:hypothetical protein
VIPAERGLRFSSAGITDPCYNGITDPGYTAVEIAAIPR